jgi:hypothetical protein
MYFQLTLRYAMLSVLLSVLGSLPLRQVALPTGNRLGILHFLLPPSIPLFNKVNTLTSVEKQLNTGDEITGGDCI